jgi:hypothetical protein
VEEHLLVCASCRDKLDEAEAFALAMRRAIATEPESPAPESWFSWLRQPVWKVAIGFAVLLLSAGLYLNVGRRVSPVASLELTAMRGAIPAVNPAQETDVTLDDAPSGIALRAEVVDADGGPVWKGALKGDDHTIRLAQHLNPTNYFVRLYDDTGKLLHEYAFRVREVAQ